MKYNQIMMTSKAYDDPKFLKALETMYNIHPYIKFKTFDAVKLTKPTDDQLEEH